MSEENLNQTEETTAKAEVAKKKKKNLNTVLLILSILFLVVGVLCLLVEPYKAWRRRTIPRKPLRPFSPRSKIL